MSFVAGPKPALHGLTSQENCLWEGAKLPFISMGFEHPALLCCGCEPAPALVYGS